MAVGERGVAEDRVARTAPLVLVESKWGREGGGGTRGEVLPSKEERDGREGLRFPWFTRRRRRLPFLPEDGSGSRHQSLMFRPGQMLCGCCCFSGLLLSRRWMN